MIAIIGTIAFALGTVAVYFHLRHRAAWTGPAVVAGASVGVAVNLAYFASTIASYGAVEAFRYNYESTLLLATLIALAALLTHLFRTLSGLDGFLLACATVIELWAMLTRGRPAGGEVAYKSWFISHSLAFALSAACFIAGGLAGIAYLLISRTLRHKRGLPMGGAVAPLESLERFGRWMLMIGFPLYTYGILTGICELVRARNPGPTAWLRDPLIEVSFLTWAAYAVAVAAMVLRPRIRGRRAATLATCGMGLIVVVFLVVEFVSPVHR